MSSGYGGPPAWPPMPPMPPGPPTVGTAPWWRRHKGWLGLGVGVVVAGLVAGVLVWQGSRSSTPDRAAFEAALGDLAAQPAIRYDTGVGGGTSAEMEVTYTGDVLGTVTVLGQKVSTMTVNGTTYLKMPNLLAGKAADPTGLAGKWITGSKASATAGTSAATSKVQTPAALANRLYTALSSKSTVLSEGKDPSDDVNGTPTRKATTPEGDLFITRDKPYRLLRYVPKSAAGNGPSTLPSLPTLPPMPSLPSGFPSLPSGFPSLPSGFPSLPSMPSLPPGLGAADSAVNSAAAPARYATPPGTLDLSRLSPSQVDTFFQKLEDSTKQLKSAIDSDIDFSLKGKADLSCSSGGCSVVAHVTSKVTSSDPEAKITGGQVNATLSATVSVEGEPAGGCTATAVLPLKGTSDIACDDVAAGPVFAEEEATKRAEAEAESEAEGGKAVPYTVSSSGQAIVQALAQVDVEALLAMEQLEKQLLDDMLRDAPPTPTASGSPSDSPSANPTVAPTDAPTGQPSSSPSASPTGPPDDQDKNKKKPTCVDRPPADHERNGADGWTFYSPVGWQNRATGAAVCLTVEATGGTRANPDSPGMNVAKIRGAKLFPKVKTPVNSCHLIPQALGGRGVMANLSPCWATPVNVGEMTGVQACVTGLMRSGIVQMYVVPMYKSDLSKIPYLFRYTVEAWDHDGNQVPQNCSRIVYNEKDGYFLNGDG